MMAEATKLTARRDRPPLVLFELCFSTSLSSASLHVSNHPSRIINQLNRLLNKHTDTMSTFFDTVKKSWEDVPVDASKDNAISTTEFLEAAESLTTLFGRSFYRIDGAVSLAKLYFRCPGLGSFQACQERHVWQRQGKHCSTSWIDRSELTRHRKSVTASLLLPHFQRPSRTLSSTSLRRRSTLPPRALFGSTGTPFPSSFAPIY